MIAFCSLLKLHCKEKFEIKNLKDFRIIHAPVCTKYVKVSHDIIAMTFPSFFNIWMFTSGAEMYAHYVCAAGFD